MNGFGRIFAQTLTQDLWKAAHQVGPAAGREDDNIFHPGDPLRNESILREWARFVNTFGFLEWQKGGKERRFPLDFTFVESKTSLAQ
jgi:hypothetical protein